MATIKQGACLIIGDEVLNGKIQDTNSHFFAKTCFRLGIDVRNVSVVPDDEREIVETLDRMRHKYDFIVTSGGIGPTHDDITYDSVAKAFGLPVEVHAESARRMERLSKFKPRDAAAQAAQLRMATLPAGPGVECLFPYDDVWVPIVALEHKVYILPGVPRLFEKLLSGLEPMLKARIPESQHMVRHFVATQMKESEIAPLLGQIQVESEANGIKIGSYPHMDIQSNTVSIIGPESESQLLSSIVERVAEGVNGTVISALEEELRSSKS
ncbi:hypothetical protein TRVA0_008S01838 [Trichomonascus vanleenenianus]|uniref:flavin adenine dinucleotide pyrophosphatase n=1 Tax=Trichomonascus vanleenenianus TaxID=2268995 RepID=UPI003ECABBC5